MWCSEGLDVPVPLSTPVASLSRLGSAKAFSWAVLPNRTSDCPVALSSADTEGESHRPGQRETQTQEKYFVDRVREYMRRDLAHDSDAFNAFAGVLKSLETTFVQDFLLGNIFGLPIGSRSRASASDSRPGSDHRDDDARSALLRSLAWSIPSLPKQQRGSVTLFEGVTDATITQRRKGVPSWTWCGWKFKHRRGTGPPPPSIERMSMRPQRRNSSVDLDLIDPESEISMEYEYGEVLSWTPDAKPQDLLAKGTHVQGDAKRLLVRGWTSQLIIPPACHNDGPSTCQCGAYRVDRGAARHLRAIAQRRGLARTETGAYVLRIWFLGAPLRLVSPARSQMTNCRGAVMVLAPTADQGVYERLETLCEIEMEYLVRRPSFEDLVCRFGFMWSEFGLD